MKMVLRKYLKKSLITQCNQKSEYKIVIYDNFVYESLL